MRRSFWTDLWFLLLFAAGGLVLTYALMMGLMLWQGQTTLVLHLSQWSQNVLLMLLPPVLWVRYYKKESVHDVLRLGWPGWKMMILTLLMMIAAMPALELIADACEQLPLPQWLVQMAEESKIMQDAVFQILTDVDGVGGWLALIMLMCVMTGLGEEALFRGALLRCFVKPGEIDRRNVIWIALSIGFIFSLIHFEVYGFIPRMLLGALFVILVWRTGSIWPAVLAHAVNNLFALIAMKEAPQWLETVCGAWQVQVASVVLAAALLWLIVKAQPRR